MSEPGRRSVGSTLLKSALAVASPLAAQATMRNLVSTPGGAVLGIRRRTGAIGVS